MTKKWEQLKASTMIWFILGLSKLFLVTFGELAQVALVHGFNTYN